MSKRKPEGQTMDEEVPMRVQLKTAAAMDDQVLECRMMRHSFHTRFNPTTDQLNSHYMGKPIGFTCSVCGTIRIDVYSILGKLVWRKYIRPDNYSTTRDKRPSLDVVRIELLKRWEVPTMIAPTPPKEDDE